MSSPPPQRSAPSRRPPREATSDRAPAAAAAVAISTVRVSTPPLSRAGVTCNSVKSLESMARDSAGRSDGKGWVFIVNRKA